MPGNQERGSVPFGETEDLCITSNQCVGGSNTYHKQNRSQESEGGEQTDQKIIKRHVCVFAERLEGVKGHEWLKLASFQHDIQIVTEGERNCER